MMSGKNSTVQVNTWSSNISPRKVDRYVRPKAINTLKLGHAVYLYQSFCIKVFKITQTRSA